MGDEENEELDDIYDDRDDDEYGDYGGEASPPIKAASIPAPAKVIPV